MSRRSSLFFAPFIIFAVVGVALAFTSLFPNSANFQVMPTGAGTLGDVLTHYFGSDGTARNADKLNGRTATGYVGVNGSTCPATEVWKGISSTGTVICGPRGALLTIGKFCQDLGSAVRVNGQVPNMTTTILKEGDTIQTNGDTATICLDGSQSIARLDTGTNLTLSRGTLAGNTVPQLEVTSGKAWGRVLTSTGVNIGGGGLIAGVRGTSVSVEKNSDIYTVSIVDSQKSYNTFTDASGRSYPAPTGSQISTNTNPDNPNTLTNSLNQVGTLNLLSYKTWINDNTRKDIAYLNSIKTTGTIIAYELAVTEPRPTDIGKQNALCNPGGGTDFTFWQGMTDPGKVCQMNNLIAFSDPTTGFAMRNASNIDSVSVSVKSNGNTLNNPTSLVAITAIGDYMSYGTGYLNTLVGGTLSGKTVTIELANPLDLPDPVSPATSGPKRYLFDGGNIQYWAVNGACAGEPAGKKICQKISGSSTTVYVMPVGFDIATSTSVPLNISINPTSFIVGAFNLSGNFQGQIQNTIKKISIQ